MTPAIPEQRSSELAVRRRAENAMHRLAVEAEAQAPGEARPEALIALHLARLFGAPPGLVPLDMSRLAAALFDVPMPSEPHTDEVVVHAVEDGRR